MEGVLAHFAAVIIVDPESPLRVGGDVERTGESIVPDHAAGVGIDSSRLAKTGENFAGLRINDGDLVGGFAAIKVEGIADEEAVGYGVVGDSTRISEIGNRS